MLLWCMRLSFRSQLKLEIDLDTLLRVLLLNELQRRNEVAVGTDKDDGIGGVEHTVGYHADGDVHVGLLFLWS